MWIYCTKSIWIQAFKLNFCKTKASKWYKLGTVGFRSHLFFFAHQAGKFRFFSPGKDLKVVGHINYALSQYLSITATHARALNKEFIEAVEKMASKLKKLVSDYEAGGFLHSLSVLDPCKKSTWRSEFRNLMRRLPFYEANKQIIEADLIKYCMYTPPNTKANLTGYCQSLKNQFPALSQQTIQYLLYYCGSREELCFFQTNISRYQNQLDNSAPQPMDCEQFQYLKGKTLRSQKGAGRRGGKDSWRGQSGGRINF
eukprot:TRINITY_DN9925_c0_g1_i12.p1 TRINITY_DN9925_c0_g1~~TRINITY_DN9925_c0_g1_i12.p1  ORF type:complete len:256 (-),score=-21.77 TRINITY_DN9925_c0_g1_i12:395-1162(-)